MSDIRAAVIAGPGSAPTIQMLDQPRVGRRAALYAIGACGVSDADLALLRGEGRPDLAWPLTPGQEAAGVLEEMGPDLTEDCLGAPLRVGAKILVPAFAPCLRCPVCLHYPAQATRCLHPVQLRGGWADRGHTDFAAHPGARLYRLPDDMPLWLATLTAPFATAQRALRRAQDIGRFPPGATVAVHGTGAVALLAVAAAQEMGAGRLIVAGGPEDSFARLCRQFGAEATIGADTPAETVEIVRETVGGLGVDLVLSFRVAVADSLAMLRDGGSCVDLGPGAGGMPSDVATRDLILIGSAGHAPADLPGAVRMLHRAQGRYPFLKMLSRHPLTTAGIVEATGSSAPKAVLVGNPDIIGP
jgi:D-arabinose 1-dehydrogenase-like Zn-dependent alcohol dehydrogenase